MCDLDALKWLLSRRRQTNPTRAAGGATKQNLHERWLEAARTPRMEMRAARVAARHSQKRSHCCGRSEKTKVLRSPERTERAFVARIFSEEANPGHGWLSACS
jgi:hypothetical protein